MKTARTARLLFYYTHGVGFFILFMSICQADSPQVPAVKPPLIGQPENFSGAVLTSCKVVAQAQPTDLHAEEPLIFSLRITCTGQGEVPPRRPNLRLLPKFQGRFGIQDLPDRDIARVLESGQEWVFHYQLKPRGVEVTEIPALRFDYYKPGSNPPAKGYRTTYSESIPLTVKPRLKAVAVDAQGEPIRAPSRFYRLVEGPGVLRHDEVFHLPPLPILGLFLTIPPAFCLVWYFVWRRRYPDAARRARLRRSRAAQRALAVLRAVKQADRDEQAKTALKALSAYLWRRFDVHADNLKYTETAQRLERAGISADLAGQLTKFFHACDAARFAADFPPGKMELAIDAETLILAMETNLCSSSAA